MYYYNKTIFIKYLTLPNDFILTISFGPPSIPALSAKRVVSDIADTRASSSAWPAAWRPFASAVVARRLLPARLTAPRVPRVVCLEPRGCRALGSLYPIHKIQMFHIFF